MPSRPPCPCSHPGCFRYAVKNSRCEEHQPIPWDHNGKTSKERGYNGSWTKLRKQAMNRDQWLCQICDKLGMLTKATECDHIVPKAQGGTDSLDNLQAVCTICHKAKTLRESREGRGDG